MAMLNELTCEGPFCTSYVHFYSSMIKCPWIGTNYNEIMSFLMIVVGLGCALLSILRC